MTGAADSQPQFMRIDEQEVRYRVHRGSGENVLLIFNGVGAGLELLQPFVDALRDTTTIAYDVPGAGESPAPIHPWRPRRHVALAAELLTRLGFERVAVLGISWGGALAQQFAYQYPERCSRLILAATSPGHLMVPGQPAVLLRMASPQRYINRDYMRAVAGKLYGGALRNDEGQARLHASRMRAPSTRGYYYQILGLLGWTSLPWLRKLKQPTLVMAGIDDPLVRVINCRILAKRIPNARLQLVDCGHLFLLTRAAELAPEIEAFLASGRWPQSANI
jgi:poly(3-hydroxyalkanoate) depolymerase